MASRSEIIAARQTAGATYAAALTAFYAALSEVRAYDLACRNARLQGESLQFLRLPQFPSLVHPEFGPFDASLGDVEARADEILRSLSE